MIVVSCSSGDWAEATTPAAALVAARALLDDAWNAHPTQGHKPTCSFEVDGQPVAGLVGVGEAAIWKALGAAESPAATI